MGKSKRKGNKMRTKVNQTQKTKSTGPINAWVALIAGATLLLLAESAQAWWLMDAYLVWRGGW